MGKKIPVEIRVTKEQEEAVMSVAKQAGVKPETVIKVILALFVLQERRKGEER